MELAGDVPLAGVGFTDEEDGAEVGGEAGYLEAQAFRRRGRAEKDSRVRDWRGLNLHEGVIGRMGLGLERVFCSEEKGRRSDPLCAN